MLFSAKIVRHMLFEEAGYCRKI
uniref:Uncharacterized protein n=1 Tax=Romanomermis culicivorax TaxID=13658 RepID=A0A915IEC4_ROMCU